MPPDTSSLQCSLRATRPRSSQRGRWTSSSGALALEWLRHADASSEAQARKALMDVLLLLPPRP